MIVSTSVLIALWRHVSIVSKPEPIALAVYHVELLSLQLQRIETLELEGKRPSVECVEELARRIADARAAIEKAEQYLGREFADQEAEEMARRAAW